MIELSVQQISEAVGGRIVGMDETLAASTTCDSATTDSREVSAGTLFIAKPGEVTDGHRFIGVSRDAGSPVALAERETSDPEGAVYPAIVVDDVVEAMGALAHDIVGRLRRHGDVTVVGITGSAGKTTTKDLLAGIFAEEGPTVAPIGSYNGEVGVPLTVFRADYTTRFLVIEMGANHLGNIRYLCDMVVPDYGAILKVGTAHAGEFGGVENIAITKSELADGVASTGGVALNLDDTRVAPMQSKASAPVTYFGVEGCHVGTTDHDLLEAKDLRTDEGGCPHFRLSFPNGDEFSVASKLMGEHHVYNLLAAASLAFMAGLRPEAIVQGLNTLGAGSRYRMERTDRPDGVTVINDAYNANPESMAAALRTLAQMGRDAQPPRRTWAVLGPMLELGEASVEEHDKVGRDVVRLNIPKLVVIGEEAAPLFNAAHLEGSWGDEAVWVKDADEAFEILRRELEPGDIALFKSSNGAGLRFLGDRVAHDQTGGPQAGHALGRKAQGNA